MRAISPGMRSCIEECLRCYQMCLAEASQHCLEAGGKHVEPGHFRLMLACAEACRTSAHMMLLGVAEHKQSCAACAAFCEACAASCEQVGGMQECVEVCRACAESCRRMAA